ncbi:MAG TPA: hypothetical protein VGC78_00585 [Gaiellaceae bacterium]
MRSLAGVAAVLVLVAAGIGGRSAHARGGPLARAAVETVREIGTAAVPAARRAASSWCGTTSPTDRPPAVTGYSIHVIYAIPSDGADQSATYAPQISDIVDQVSSWWQREDPSRAPRFDVYAAPCGPQVDLTVVRMPAVSVATTDAHQVFESLWTQLQADPTAPYSKFVVFVDDVDTGLTCGVGGPSAASGLGNPAYGVASVFLQSCNGADRATVAAHELLHAVSPAAGFTGAAHTCANDPYHVCDSTGDVLYPYVEAGIPLTSLQLDVGHDDYWAGTAPVNLQVQPWFRHVQDQVHLGLSIAGQGTVTSDLPGLACATTCGTDWDRGDAVALTPTPAAGQRFVRWTGACTGASCAVTLDASKDVGALFAPATFTLDVRVSGSGRVTSSPGGISCRRGDCKKAFTSFAGVALTEKAAKGWRFSGWSGACRGTRTRCTVPMAAATAVRASFARKR